MKRKIDPSSTVLEKVKERTKVEAVVKTLKPKDRAETRKKNRDSMTVSAVVTTLNEEEYIEECLRSILDQTVDVDEIILVDANSTDSTREKAQQYPISLITVDFNDVLRSKDKGIQESENPIILCVDGDSYLEPDFVENGLELMENHDAVSGKITPHDPNPITNAIATYRNYHFGGYSGPAFLIKKQSYLSWKKNHWNDRSYAEIPLKMMDTLESSKLIVETELPSHGQKAGFQSAAISVGLGIAVAGGEYLLEREKDK